MQVDESCICTKVQESCSAGKNLCFISLKVGIAVQEGLLSLDDPFMKYFPEYRNENTSERFEETTIRDIKTLFGILLYYFFLHLFYTKYK